MKKTILLLMLIVLFPLVHAQSEEEKCGLTNLATCIPEKLYQYTLSIINAPIQPLLTLTKGLLSEPVKTDIFIPIWAIIIYIISMFYGIFIVMAGFNFIISGYSYEKRERAKEWLKNIVLMVLFVQGSYYLYSIAIEVSAAMSSGIINQIDPNFFLFTIDNLSNVGLSLIFGLFYVLTLMLTILFLALRYLLVAVGVLFFPFGLFFNFIPPLQSYGKLIVNTLMIVIFLPFINSLMLLAASLLVDIPVFQNFKITVMICAFLLVNITMLLLAFFAIAKSAMAAMRSDVGRAVALVAK